MTVYIIFSVVYFGLLIWGFFLGRNSVFDNWFNDVIWEKVLDENGDPITCIQDEDIDKTMTDDEQIEFLTALIEASQEQLDEVKKRKYDANTEDKPKC